MAFYPVVIATACWLCLDPGLNPITNDQTPVVPFCYRIINMLNCGTERHGESGVHRASVFSLATVASYKDHSPHNNDVGF
jgi:hypothetical protein